MIFPAGRPEEISGPAAQCKKWCGIAWMSGKTDSLAGRTKEPLCSHLTLFLPPSMADQRPSVPSQSCHSLLQPSLLRQQAEVRTWIMLPYIRSKARMRPVAQAAAGLQTRGAMSLPQHVSSSRPCPMRLADVPNETADAHHQSQARTAYGEQRCMLDSALSRLRFQ